MNALTRTACALGTVNAACLQREKYCVVLKCRLHIFAIASLMMRLSRAA